jgi:formylmethanofuran dehydrogenase subunit E
MICDQCGEECFEEFTCDENDEIWCEDCYYECNDDDE